MPYISESERERMEIFNLPAWKPGALAYQLTKMILIYLENGGRGAYNYADLAQVLGVLESVKLEFYRRMIAPYEDEKCRENGDVFP